MQQQQQQTEVASCDAHDSPVSSVEAVRNVAQAAVAVDVKAKKGHALVAQRGVSQPASNMSPMHG